jgi:hypothetical protein
MPLVRLEGMTRGPYSSSTGKRPEDHRVLGTALAARPADLRRFAETDLAARQRSPLHGTRLRHDRPRRGMAACLDAEEKVSAKAPIKTGKQ